MKTYFRAVSGSQQNWAEGTETSHIPSSRPPTSRVSFIINFYYLSDIIFAIDEAILTGHNLPRFIVYITVTFGAVYYIDLEKCKVTCIHHHGIIQSVLTALKILYMPPFHPSLHPNFSKPLFFSCFHSFTFSRMSYGWNYTVYSFFIDSQCLNIHLRFLHVFLWNKSSIRKISSVFLSCYYSI